MPLLTGDNSKAKPHKVIEYMMLPTKAAVSETLNISLPQGADAKAIADAFEKTAKSFNKWKSYKERKYYHYKFSPNRQDNVSYEVCQAAAMELARALFPGHEIVISTHVDTRTVHSHIIINSVNFKTGLSLNIKNREYVRQKDFANEIGLKYGMTPLDWRSATEEKRQLLKEGLAIDPTVTEQRIVLRGGTSWKEELREVIDLAKKKCDNIIEFEDFLERYGIVLPRCTDTTISYLHPKRNKPIRGYRLGEGYTAEAIDKCFLEKQSISTEKEEKTTSVSYNTADIATENTYPWYAMEAIPGGLSDLERLALQQKIVTMIELKLAIRNSAWVSYDYTEFLERLEDEYGVRLRETKDGTVLIHQNGTEIKASELGKEYEKEAVMNVINRPKNGQDGGRNLEGDKRKGASPNGDDLGTGERRADNAPSDKQAADAKTVRKR